MREWIDTHLHLLYPEELHYDWTRSFELLNRRFALEEYALAAQAADITRALHMECDVRENEIELETQLVADLAGTQGSPVVGAISACRPESAEFPKFLERQQANPVVRGLRRVLHVVPDEVSQSALFRTNLRRLASTGYPFDLHVLARQLPLAIDLARACPDVPMVLNHCGVPNVAGQELSPWRDAMRELAALPNVSCKISGVIAYGDKEGWLEGGIDQIATDLRPFVEHAIECFGWKRVVWGSDFPVCNLTRGLLAWKEVTDRILQGSSAAELDALAHGNAIRLYGLKETTGSSTASQQ